MEKSEEVEVLSSGSIIKIIIIILVEINLIDQLTMEIGLIIIIIKVIKSTKEIWVVQEVESLVHQELIVIMRKELLIFLLMKEIIIRKVLITEVTNIEAELVVNKVILGKEIIITKVTIDKLIITNLEILIKKIDGMMRKEILNLKEKTGIMKLVSKKQRVTQKIVEVMKVKCKEEIIVWVNKAQEKDKNSDKERQKIKGLDLEREFLLS